MIDTTALHAANREKFAVTRHGPPRSPAAASPLRPMFEFAPSLVTDASALPLTTLLHRKAHPIPQRCGRIAPRLALPTAGRDITRLNRKPKYP